MSMIRLTIHWINLSNIPNENLLDCFAEFQQQLASNFPDLPTPTFIPTPTTLVSGMPEYLLSNLPGKVDQEEAYPEYKNKSIFVMCKGDEDFVNIFQNQNGLAHWGIAVPCKFSIAWEPNKFLIWHELLHLMNAKDCYNKFGINKCPNSNCLMRRATNELNFGYGSRLTLCSKNITRIRRFTANLKALPI